MHYAFVNWITDNVSANNRHSFNYMETYTQALT